MAIAGILDAQNYIFTERSIKLEAVLDMAKNAASTKVMY